MHNQYSKINNGNGYLMMLISYKMYRKYNLLFHSYSPWKQVWEREVPIALEHLFTSETICLEKFVFLVTFVKYM